jgi:hypothetical protein
MVTSDVYKNAQHLIAQMWAETRDEKKKCLFRDTIQDKKYISELDTVF